MIPKTKLSTMQMQKLLERTLLGTDTPQANLATDAGKKLLKMPLKDEIRAGTFPGLEPPMEPGMMPPLEEPAPEGMGPMSVPEAPAPPPAEVQTIIAEAEEKYDLLMKSGPLKVYWDSLFRTNPEAKRYGDPELMFISLFIKRKQDPAGFEQAYPEEARLFSKMDSVGGGMPAVTPTTGMAQAPGLAPPINTPTPMMPAQPPDLVSLYEKAHALRK